MDAADALRHLGGVATPSQVIALSSRRRLRTALDRREVVRASRGRLVLPDVRRHHRRAAELTAVVSHLSAAQHWGWAVKEVPEQVWLIVPRHRKVAAEDVARCRIFFADLVGSEVVDGVTAPLRTVLDCARALPFDEALAVADSALRSGDVDARALRESAATARGPGSARVRRVAEAADGRAANPFESVLRAIVLEVGGLDVVPQEAVAARGQVFHPDLVDQARRVVIEADSWGFHADKRTHDRDCVRYTAMTVAGWVVLRFTWDQVMHSPAYVRAVLEDLVAGFAPRPGSTPTRN